MNKLSALLSVLLILPLSSLQAAYQTMSVPSRQLIIEDGASRYQAVQPSYMFRIELVSDNDGVKPETFKNGRPFVAAQKNERYAVRLYNPLPVRVAVNLTIDGINSISGKPSGIRDGEKWMIEPYGFITIRGWQVNSSEARRFFFTDKPKSYAKWRGRQLGQNLAANCGVIGAAYFWSQKELDAYYDAHPVYVNNRSVSRAACAKSFNGASSLSEGTMLNRLDDALQKDAKKEKAGTGMGERENFATTQVQFDYDTGMSTLSQAVVIYYDFAEAALPDPFPALGFAPEM
jgi:hypothetical protein